MRSVNRCNVTNAKTVNKMLKLLKSFPRRASVRHIPQSWQFLRYCQHKTKSENVNATSSTDGTTHFGFETVREDEKEEKG